MSRRPKRRRSSRRRTTGFSRSFSRPGSYRYFQSLPTGSVKYLNELDDRFGKDEFSKQKDFVSYESKIKRAPLKAGRSLSKKALKFNSRKSLNPFRTITPPTRSVEYETSTPAQRLLAKAARENEGNALYNVGWNNPRHPWIPPQYSKQVNAFLEPFRKTIGEKLRNYLGAVHGAIDQHVEKVIYGALAAAGGAGAVAGQHATDRAQQEFQARTIQLLSQIVNPY